MPRTDRSQRKRERASRTESRVDPSVYPTSRKEAQDFPRSWTTTPRIRSTDHQFSPDHICESAGPASESGRSHPPPPTSSGERVSPTDAERPPSAVARVTACGRSGRGGMIGEGGDLFPRVGFRSAGRPSVRVDARKSRSDRCAMRRRPWCGDDFGRRAGSVKLRDRSGRPGSGDRNPAAGDGARN